MTNSKVVLPIALRAPGFTALLVKQQADVQNHQVDLPCLHVILSA